MNHPSVATEAQEVGKALLGFAVLLAYLETLERF